MSEIIHRDIFNREIVVGDKVLLSTNGGWGQRLIIGTIKKINPKMINVQPLNSRRVERRYPFEVLVVTDDPRLSAFILTNSETIGQSRRKR